MQSSSFIIKELQTPIGTMIAIADKEHLHLLEFTDSKKLKQKLMLFAASTGKDTPPLVSIEKELISYFEGSLKTFKTPLFIHGTSFQKQVWAALQTIPYAITVSYAAIATSIGMKTGFRAVAQANGANRFAIVIPCHRVINSNGALGGYSSGLIRKEWLLNHEQRGYLCNKVEVI